MVARIPVFRPRLPPQDTVAPYLRLMDQSRLYSNGGPLLRLLEARYAEFLRVPEERVIAVSSGTAGLMAAVLAGDSTEWVVPAWTFAASPLAVQRANKKLIFHDVDRKTGVLKVERLSELSSDTGLMPVLPYGTFEPGVQLLARPHVILDAAASIVNAAGRLGALQPESAVVFSLHATKILGCGEGGLVVTGSDQLAESVRSTINFGFDGQRSSTQPGFNGKMPEAMAAYALAALDASSTEIEAWRSRLDLARQVTSAFDLDLFSPSVDEIGPYWVVRWPHDEEDMPSTIEETLARHGVETRRWWPASCSTMGAFDPPSGPMPNSDWLSRNTLGLPMYVDLSDLDFQQIERALAEALKQ